MRFLLTMSLLAGLHFHSLGQTTPLSRDWTAFAQRLKVADIKQAVKLKPGKIKLRITAQVKLLATSKQSMASIWLRAETKEGKKGYFDNMNDRPIQSAKWRTYLVEASLGKNIHQIYFGGLCKGNGKFYFDNFEVWVQNSQEHYEKVPLANASFEEKVTSNTLSQWFEGIRPSKKVRVKEYTFSSSTDKTDGKYALLVEGKGVTINPPNSNYLIGPIEGYTPQVGTMVTMLNNLSHRIAQAVKGLSQEAIDWQEDEQSNSIGALIIHLAATEAYYQTFTFEGRKFNDEETLKWAKASSLGDAGRKAFKGKSIDYYLNICREVRKKTLEKFKTLDDVWLAKKIGKGAYNNHFCWFHVMEHQATHLGQIYMIKKKLKQRGIK